MGYNDTELHESEPYYRDFGEKIEQSRQTSESLPADQDASDQPMQEDPLDADDQQITTNSEMDQHDADFRESLDQTDQLDDQELQDEAEEEYKTSKTQY
jgi:hypothetical protein